MAISTRTLLETVDQIYQAGCDPLCWPEVVTNCQSLFPGTAFSLFVSLDGIGHDPLSTTAGWDPQAIRQYFAHYYKLNPFPDLLRHTAPGQVARESCLVRQRWLEKQPFYQEWLKPVGNFTHGANLTLARDAGCLSRVSIDVPRDLLHLEAPAAEFLQRVAPHLLRAFALTKRLHAARAAESGLQALLDRIAGAAFLVRPPRKVVAVNGSALALLEQHRFVRISLASELSFVGRQADEILRRTLQSVFVIAEAPPSAKFILINGHSGRYPVLVLPFRLSKSLATLGAGPELALILICDRRRTLSPPIEMIRSFYGLSHAEADVVLRIAEGDSLKAAADQLAICRVTARNQLAAAMGKLGVHRQAELVALMAALAPSLDLGHDEGLKKK